MKIFIPALKDANSFFDEISIHSKHTFVYGNYTEYNETYKIVLLQWPEQLFAWKEPTSLELINFEKSIKNWKNNSKIIHIAHNLERHFGMTPKFEKIYRIVQENCDVMVHFGDFSFNLFSEKYPDKLHKIINHPLYEKTFKVYDKKYAREKLNIKQDSVVIIAPGSIRNIEERQMILNSFKNIPTKNKVLIVPRMFWLNFQYEFKGRTLLKKVFDIKKVYETYINEKKYKKPQYILGYKFLKNKELSLLMSAVDIVLIPRINILNSGNLFLGLTFKKIIIGPKVGNIEEVLDTFDFPKFNPKNPKSISDALIKGIDLLKTENKIYKNVSLSKYKPKAIAEKWDHLCCNIIK